MFIFPDPSIQDTFSLGNKTWKWNGSYWDLIKEQIIIPENGISFYQQSTAPVGAKAGDKWLNSNNMNEFTYVQTSSSPEKFQWIDLSGDYPGDSVS